MKPTTITSPPSTATVASATTTFVLLSSLFESSKNRSIYILAFLTGLYLHLVDIHLVVSSYLNRVRVNVSLTVFYLHLVNIHLVVSSFLLCRHPTKSDAGIAPLARLQRWGATDGKFPAGRYWHDCRDGELPMGSFRQTGSYRWEVSDREVLAGSHCWAITAREVLEDSHCWAIIAGEVLEDSHW